VNLRYTLSVLLRRWYVVVPVLVLTLLAALQARSAAEPAYTVSTNLAVLPPDQAQIQQEDGSVETVQVNPFLNFTGSTQTAASALSLIASSGTFRQTLDPVARNLPYTVLVPPRNPTLQVDVVSKDGTAALRAADAITRGLQAELDRRQASAPRSQSLSITVLTPPAVAAVDNARLRAAVVVTVLGLLIAMVLGCAVEWLAARRRRSLERREAPPVAAPAQVETSAAGQHDLRGVGTAANA
jgi:hypothetical protein